MTAIAVLSMKGGVGKTSVTLGLASAARNAALRTLVVDLDPQANATMGLATPEPIFTINDVFVDARAGVAAEAITASGWGEKVDVLASETALENRAVDLASAQALRVTLATVPQNYDVVLLDCPPSLGALTRNALQVAQVALIVTEPSYFALHGAEQAIEAVNLVRSTSNPTLRAPIVLINKARPTVAEHRNRITELQQAYPEYVHEVQIPERTAMAQVVAAGMPVHDWESPAGTELSGLFTDLLTSLVHTPRYPTGRRA